MIKDTSLEAYSKKIHSSHCKYQKLMTLRMLQIRNMAGTDMAQALKVERYCYRPRLTALQDEGLIRDSGDRKAFHYLDRQGRKRVSREVMWELVPEETHEQIQEQRKEDEHNLLYVMKGDGYETMDRNEKQYAI